MFNFLQKYIFNGIKQAKTKKNNQILILKMIFGNITLNLWEF